MRLGLRWQLLIALLGLLTATVVLISLVMLQLSERTLALQAAAGMEQSFSIVVDDAAAESDMDATRIQVTLGARSVVVCDSGVLVSAAHDPGLNDELTCPNEAPADSNAGEPQTEARAFVSTSRELVRVSAVRDGLLIVAEFPYGAGSRLLLASRRAIVMYTVLAALLILTIGFFLLTRFIVNPIRRLDHAAERVAHGDLDITVSSRSANEIGDLARNFDSMVGRLRDGRTALEGRLQELADKNEELRLAQDQLVRSEKLATVGRLAAGIAHEVGNPLSAVAGMVELLRDRDGLDDADLDDLLQRVDRELTRMDATIRDLLDYAKPPPTVARPTQISDAVESAVSLASHHKRARNLTVVSSLDDMLPSVACDERHLTQVMLNLLINAADACGESATVWISATVPEGSLSPEGSFQRAAAVVIDIVDNGPGIPSDRAERIFDPFYTTKRRDVGTGLGLAMSQRLVEQYDGTLELVPGTSGAHFRVTLQPWDLGD